MDQSSAGITVNTSTTSRPMYDEKEDHAAGHDEQNSSQVLKPAHTVNEIVVDATLEQLHKLTKLISPAYLLFALYTLIALIISFVDVEDAVKIIFFLALLGGNLFFSVAGSLGIYKWGTVAEQIDGFKSENNKFSQEIFELHETRDKLAENVNGLQLTTQQLKRDVGELENNLHEFDELKESLQDIVGDNEEIADLVNSVNSMYDNMRNTVLENKRAHILSSYYKCSLGDGQEGMTEMEYEEFLFPLPVKMREQFQSYGDFASIAGDDNIIDLQEFQGLVDQLLNDTEHELLGDAIQNNRN